MANENDDTTSVYNRVKNQGPIPWDFEHLPNGQMDEVERDPRLVIDWDDELKDSKGYSILTVQVSGVQDDVSGVQDDE